MKLQRSIVLERVASYNSLEMANISKRDMYILLIECDGGITGDFYGWSQKGKSDVESIYKLTPKDNIDEEDECEKDGCYVGTIHLPSGEEISEKKMMVWHTIPLLSGLDPRPPTKLVVRIAPNDFVSIFTDQHEVYKLIDDNGNEIPLEDLLGGKQSS